MGTTAATEGPFKVAVLSKETLVPIGCVVSVIAALVGFHLRLSGQLNELKAGQSELSNRIDTMQSNIVDRWTSSHQKVWELEVRRRNPTIDLPDTWDIVNQRPNTTPRTNNSRGADK